MGTPVRLSEDFLRGFLRARPRNGVRNGQETLALYVGLVKRQSAWRVCRREGAKEMTSAGFERLGKSGRIVTLLVGALLLALGLVLTAAPAKATHTSTCEFIDGVRVCTPDEHPNADPTISASSGSVSAGEGQVAVNTGAYSDADGNATVTLSASVGTVAKDAAGDGTWRWSFATDDGPAQSQTVTITATDSGGATASTSFSLTVNNLGPQATFNAPTSADEGSNFTLSLTNPSDPSGADRDAGFAYAFDCGGGYGAFASANSAGCNLDSGTRTVRGKIRDKDGGVTEYTRTVTVNNVAPTATFNAPQTSYAYKQFVVSMADPNDPSSADRDAGFTYAFDCGSGYGGFSGKASTTCQAGFAGTSKTVKAKIRDKDGGEREYTSNVTVNAAPPSYPNGRIAFISSRDGGNLEVYTTNADGTGTKRLTYTAAMEFNAAFSPDGKKIAYDREGEIYVMNANGTNQTRLTDVPGHDVLPAFSPDGNEIAFASHRDGGQAEIYVMDADGTNPRRLTNNASHEMDPAFSPNGSQVAFTSDRDGGNYEIYVVNTDGTGQTRLTNSSDRDIDPTYSYDGSRIAFESHRMGNPEIFAMRADGAAPIRLTNDPAEDIQPAYAPSNLELAFTSHRDGNYEIYKMNDLSTAAPTRLTDSTAIEADPTWGGRGDITPPPTFITSGPANSSFSNSTSATFEFRSGSLEPSPAFECQLDGGAFEPCTSAKTYNNLGVGEHTFKVQAIDTSGNVDPTPEVRTWTIDLTRPTITGITPPDGAPGILEGTNATVTFDEAMNASTLNGTTFTLTRQGASSPVAATYGYDTATNTATLNPDADLDSLATYTVLVKSGSEGVKDRAGNSILQDRTWSFRTGDTRAPNVSLTSPADGATVGGAVQLAADATDNGVVDRVDFLVNGSVVDSDGAPPYAVNWNSAGVTSGATVQITARAIDTSSNQATSTAHTVTVDNVPPETTLDPSGPSGTVNSTSASFSFSSEAGATFECKLDAEAFAACDSPKGYTGLSDGSHTFQVRAGDAAGNVDANPEGRTWTVDAMAPTVTVVTPPVNATGVAVSENVTAAFSEAMDASTLNGTTFTLTRQGGAAVTATVSYDPATRKATLDPNANLDADAAYTATVEGGAGGARDTAGNPLAQDSVWSFGTAAPPDTTAPNGAVVVDADAPFTTDARVTLTLGASDPSPGTGVASMRFSNDGNAWTEWEPYAAGNREWDLVVGDGTKTVHVEYKDGAGNIKRAEDSITLDTTKPETTLDPSGPSGTINTNLASFSFTSEAGATFECRLTRQGETAGTFTACTSPEEYPDLTDGSYAFEVRATDRAGNVEAPTVGRSFTVDTAAPPIPAITGGPPEGSTSTSRSATFAFGSEDGATFLCSLDGAGFSGCTSGQPFTGLSDGPHRFEVKAKDRAGNESAIAVRLWNVDATAPTIKNWTPKGTGIKPTAKPTVVFSEAMKETSLEKSLNGKPTTFFLKRGTTKVAATVSYVETQTATGAKVYKAVMTPSKRLVSGVTYTATVTTAARDAAGNPLEVLKTWRFTVG